MSATRAHLRLLSEDSHRKNFLQERSYKLPGTGVTAMFDWYALYALWFAIGRGKIEHGYASAPVGDRQSIYDPEAKPVVAPTMMPEPRANLINASYEECTRQIAIRLINAIKQAVVSEAENFVDEYLIPTDEVVAAAAENKVIAKFVQNGKVIFPVDFWATFSYQEATQLFASSLWEQHADAYGGDKWVAIVDLLMKLHEALKTAGNVKKLTGIIDAIYDLEHNTGALASKLGPEANVSPDDLDIRFSLKTPQDYLPYVSPTVKGLITSALNYLS